MDTSMKKNMDSYFDIGEQFLDMWTFVFKI
jgi:hypothetical protein